VTRSAEIATPSPAIRPAVARTPLVALAVGVTLLLLAFAGRYGYHRDELYFLRAGRELAFGYVDQPPLTPALAAAMDALVPGSLVALRLPSALAAGAVVVLTGLIAREFGGGRSAQLLAAACMAVSSILLIVGHLLSTTTFDLLAWAALSWLLVRALRDGGPVWLAAGAVAGIALQNKLSPAFLVVAVVLGVLTVGPRQALRSPWPWLGGVLALAVWAPHLVWQAANGWPQLDLAEAIAGGSSGTSEPWYLFLPFQLVLVSPVLVPVWVAGWWRLLRDPELRSWRAFAVTYVVLAVFFLLTGGKPYYLAGLYPMLVAAGAGPVVAWARHGSRRGRRAALGAALALSLLIDGVIGLPVVPVSRLADTRSPTSATTPARPWAGRVSPPRWRACAGTCRPARGSSSSRGTTARPVPSTASPPNSVPRTAATTPIGRGARPPRTPTRSSASGCPKRSWPVGSATSRPSIGSTTGWTWTTRNRG
jgi:hypothetical protein